MIELAVTSLESSGDTIRALVDAGAAVDTVNAFGHTLLMQAAMFNVDPTVVEALLDAGLDATLRSNDGRRATAPGGTPTPPFRRRTPAQRTMTR